MIILFLAGLFGIPYLAITMGSQATLSGMVIFGLILVAIMLYNGKYSTFDSTEGPMHMAICYAAAWSLIWLAVGFVRANRSLIEPYIDSVLKLLFK